MDKVYEGKVLRMNSDGTIPTDNPTINGVQSHVFTYGHLNAQGITAGPNGNLYVAEHGDKSDDECIVPNLEATMAGLISRAIRMIKHTNTSTGPGLRTARA